MAIKRPAKRKRSGIFIYCSDDWKRKLKSAAALAGGTLSGYVMEAARDRLASDTKRLKKSR